jgi:hypothetical protein
VNIDELVMAAAQLHRVYAAGSETFAGPAGSRQSVVEFPDPDQARRFASACMTEGIPARAYGAAVVVLHDEQDG